MKTLNNKTVYYALKMLRARAAATQQPEYYSAAAILEAAINDNWEVLHQLDYYPHVPYPQRGEDDAC